jgi:hypothetical protein
MNGLKNVVYVHNGVVFSHKEKWNYAGTGEFLVKQGKPGSNSQKSHDFPHMWKLDL